MFLPPPGRERKRTSDEPGATPMINDPTTCSARHPDGYAGVIPVDDLNELAYFARTACRHNGPVRMRRCAHAVLRTLLCPCVWNEECVTGAIEQELVGADTRPSPSCRQSGSRRDNAATAYFDAGPDAPQYARNDRLDRALDEALADTFPASDPIALGV